MKTFLMQKTTHKMDKNYNVPIIQMGELNLCSVSHSF